MTGSQRVLAAVAAVVGLAGMPAPPADAAAVAGGVFIGTAVTPALWSSWSPNCGVNTCPGGSGGWSLTSLTGLGVAVSDAPAVSGPVLNLSASGTLCGAPSTPLGHCGPLGAWCELSSGSGVFHVSIHPPSIHVSVALYWLTSAGSVAVLTSVSGSATVGVPVALGVVEMLPPNPVLGGGSCLDGSASAVTWVGALVAAG